MANLSSWYWLKQAARKNKTLVIGTSLAFLGLVTGLVFAVSFGIKEQQARTLAEQKAESNRQVVAFVNDLFSHADPGKTLGEQLTVKQVVQGTRYEINKSLSPEPVVAAQIRLILGNAFKAMELFEDALAHYNQGLSRLTRRDAFYFQLLVQKATVLGSSGHYEQQQTVLNEAKSQIEASLRKQPENLMLLQLDNQLDIERAAYYSVNNEPDKARQLLTELLEDPYNSKQMNYAIQKNLGYIERNQGQLQEAEQRFSRIVSDSIQEMGEYHPLTLDLQQELALTIRMQNRIDEALSIYQQVVAGMQQNYGENSLSTLLAKINQATAYMYGGQFQQANEMTQALLPAMIEHVGPNHLYTVILRNIRAGALQNVGQLDEALALYQKALDIVEQSSNPDIHSQVNFAHNMATIYFKQKHYDLAAEVYQKMYPLCLKNLGKDQPLCIIVADSYAAALIELEEYSLAEELLAYSNPALINIFGEQHPRVQASNKRKALLQEATAP